MASLARILPLWAARCRAAHAAHGSLSGSPLAPAAARCAMSACQSSTQPTVQEQPGSHQAAAGTAKSGAAGQHSAGITNTGGDVPRLTCSHSKCSGGVARVEQSHSCCSAHKSKSVEGVVTAVACALLQQAAERLDRLRKVLKHNIYNHLRGLYTFSTQGLFLRSTSFPPAVLERVALWHVATVYP